MFLQNTFTEEKIELAYYSTYVGSSRKGIVAIVATIHKIVRNDVTNFMCFSEKKVKILETATSITM